ncbi:MAG: L-2-amino-thiazoline-4-carboxylic acid hydrolase [Promethearchaeota archaeon]
MEIIHRSYYNPNAKYTFKLHQQLNQILKMQDLFFVLLKNELADRFVTIMEDFIPTLSQFVEEKCDYEYQVDLPLLGQYPDVIQLYMGMFIQYAPLSDLQGIPADKEIEMQVGDYIRASLFQKYYTYKTLTEILPREEAITLLKKIIDKNIQSVRDPEKYYKGPIAAFVKDDRNYQMYQTFGGIDAVIAITNETKIATKVLKCRWADVLGGLEDPEVGYLVTCYGDFEARKNFDPEFELTRTKTLMQGDPYCDFCDHDKRSGMSVVHPEEAFWENLQ